MSYFKCWLFGHKVDLSYGHSEYRCQRCNEECEPTTDMLKDRDHFDKTLKRHADFVENIRKSNERIDRLKRENEATVKQIAREKDEHTQAAVRWAIKEQEKNTERLRRMARIEASPLSEDMVHNLIDACYESNKLIRETTT